VVVPGVGSLRDLHRFWTLPLLCLCVAAGFGATQLLDALPARRRTASLAAIVAVAWIELAFRPPLATIDLSPKATAANLALRRLPPGPVLELPEPLGRKLSFENTTRQVRSLIDFDRRVDGYSGNLPAVVQTLEYFASRAPVDELVPVMRGYGVRYLVLHGTAKPCQAGYAPDEMATIVASLASTLGVAVVVPAGSDEIAVLEPAPIDRRVPTGPPGPIRSTVCS
jgi:hypothetical protein